MDFKYKKISYDSIISFIFVLRFVNILTVHVFKVNKLILL